MHLDIVFPAHNEEARIDRTLTRYRRVLTGSRTSFVVALDGCEDGTAAVVARHAGDDARVRAVDLPKLGKGGALVEAIRGCAAPVVAFTDADGATPPMELLRLAEHVGSGSTDLAIASRRLPASVTPARRAAGRRLTSTGFAAGIRTLFGIAHADTQCGAKALSSSAARQIVPLLSSRDFLFDVDLLVTAHRLHLRIEELPIVWVDQWGSKVDVARDTRKMAASALRLWIHHRVLPVQHRPAPVDDPEEVIDLVDHIVAGRRADDERLVSA